MPEVKLPESYEMLCEFFNCFESSTRLLRMKRSKATFPNICASIQNLADRGAIFGCDGCERTVSYIQLVGGGDEEALIVVKSKFRLWSLLALPAC